MDTEPAKSGFYSASCQNILRVAQIQSREQRGPVEHWYLEYFALCLPLPRALFSSEGGWKSQCTEGQDGGHLTQVRMQGFPLLPCFAAGVKIQRTSEPCGTLTRHLWGVVGQGFCVVVSEHDVSDTERVREKKLILLPKPSVREVGSGSVPTPGIRAGSCNLLLSPPAVAHKETKFQNAILQQRPQGAISRWN